MSFSKFWQEITNVSKVKKREGGLQYNHQISQEMALDAMHTVLYIPRLSLISQL